MKSLMRNEVQQLWLDNLRGLKERRDTPQPQIPRHLHRTMKEEDPKEVP